MKKTKIVATIGPATESKEMLEKLLGEGMDVMRLNFSHGDFAEHGRRVANLRKASKKIGKHVAIIQDLGGPKIRLGEFYKDRVLLKQGDSIIITTDNIVGDEGRVSINYKQFPKEVKVGDKIMLDDGKKKLEVIKIKEDHVSCRILIGGETKGRRGVNLPDSELSVSSLTEKDKEDLKFGIKNKVDFIALSFVRKPEDILELREILKKAKSKARIIAKIETPQAVSNIDEILKLAHGIMVARGDLAIEIPTEKVPMIQKMLIRKANNAGKTVITATQMLESMIKSPVPTRAEVSDIANAILDGTDAIMLSEETTLGDHPIEAVKVMTRVAKEVERDHHLEREAIDRHMKGEMEITDSITSSVVKTAHDVGAKIIVALTETGYTARMVARHRPIPPILCFSPNQTTCNELSLSYGCRSVKVPIYDDLKKVFPEIRKYCLSKKITTKGDRAVIVAGMPFHKTGSTNMLIVETI
jgi:pyruvate kinase